MSMPNIERPLITDENSQFLRDLNLKQAETFLMNMYGNAGNEVGLIYDDVKKKPIRVITSGEGGHSVDLNKELFEGLEKDGYDISKLTFTHNHPEGNPLTQSDVMSAIEHNMKEIRAVGKFGQFGLRRNNDIEGWISKQNVKDLKSEKVKEMNEEREKNLQDPLTDRQIRSLKIDKTDVVNRSGQKAKEDLERRNLNGDKFDNRIRDPHSVEEELHQFVTLDKVGGFTNSKFSFQPNPNYITIDKNGRRVQGNRRNELQTEYDRQYGIDKPVKGKKLNLNF